MRQCTPNNHILDLVVICMLSPLHMSLSHMALLLLWLCMATYSCSSRTPLHYILLRLGPLWDHDPGLCQESLIAHVPSWAHYVSVNMKKQDRECNCEWEREQEWGREHMPDAGREHKCEWAVWGRVVSPALRYTLFLPLSLFISFLLTFFLGITDDAHHHTSIALTLTITPPLCNPTQHHSSCVIQKMTLCTILHCSSEWQGH